MGTERVGASMLNRVCAWLDDQYEPVTAMDVAKAHGISRRYASVLMCEAAKRGRAVTVGTRQRPPADGVGRNLFLWVST